MTYYYEISEEDREVFIETYSLTKSQFIKEMGYQMRNIFGHDSFKYTTEFADDLIKAYENTWAIENSLGILSEALGEAIEPATIVACGVLDDSADLNTAVETFFDVVLEMFWENHYERGYSIEIGFAWDGDVDDDDDVINRWL